MMVPEKLRTARKACRLTQNQVAEILGVDRSAYTYYETGKTSPSLVNLARLAAMFHVEVQWFFEESQQGKTLSSGDNVFAWQEKIAQSGMLDLSGEERQLVAFYRAMKCEGKGEAVLEALRQVRDSEPPADDGNNDG